MASSTLPETLRSVTSTKIQELKKQRDEYEASKQSILREAKPLKEALERTEKLLRGDCRVSGIAVVDDDSSSDSEIPPSSNLAKVRRNQQLFLRQAKKDPAFTSALVEGIQTDLLEHLQLQSVQHEHAQFFSELVTEWLSESAASPPGKGSTSATRDDESFESVGRKEMHEQRVQWEALVFGKSKVDAAEIKDYLETLFTSETAVKQAYQKLKNSTRNFGHTLEYKVSLFNIASLKTAIQSVIQADLLSAEKCGILKSFQHNGDVLQEVADVLNMRFARLDSWGWTTANGAISVHQRRQLNGKYRVFMDEDVLDALLLHAVGMKWAVHFKSCFTQFFRSYAWNKSPTTVPKIDQERREYFLGSQSTSARATVVDQRQTRYALDYFMTQLPIEEDEGVRGYGDEDDDDNNTSTGKTRMSPVEVKQSLLHLLITEALVAKHLRPAIPHAVVRSDFKWFGPSLSHETVFAILEFFGVGSRWMTFFRKFLEAPIRFAQDGPDGQIQIRRTGVPMSHALSDVFGEVLLFVMDFAVNHATHSYLYRLHDDFWFWGSKDLCIRGWKAMTTFASVMGVQFSEEKTGSVVFDERPFSESPEGSSGESDLDLDAKPGRSREDRLPDGDVRWGFLQLDAATVRFVIDQSMVDKHVQELKLQLSKCKSIFSYVQAYNAYLARFFSNNFGKPSNAFGREHIDNMIDMFARIQQQLFPGSSVADHLAKMAKERFGVKDIPDGFWYWPVQMGGLELQNPLVSLYGTRESMRQSARRILSKAYDKEEGAYIATKDTFERKGRIGFHSVAPSESVTFGTEFMSKDEFLRYREERSAHLGDAYEALLASPAEFNVHETVEISSWLDKLPVSTRASCGIAKNWHAMSPYWKWILTVYGPQIVETYGSVQIVDAAQVPLGVVSIMKSNRIRWHG